MSGRRLLESIESLEQQAPVVLLIDDAQWADVDSLRALLFALRRLVAARVLTLLVARDEDVMRLPEGLRRLTSGTTGRSISLDALTAASIKPLATALGVPQFSMRTAQRLREHTGGNPLYVRALLTELPGRSVAHAGNRRSRHRAPSPPRSSAGSPHAARPRERWWRPARCWASAPRCRWRRRWPSSTTRWPPWRRRTRSGCCTCTDKIEIWDVTFPHPLVQAAVYENVAPTSRVRLHRAAAELLDDAGAALRHRVAAATPPDPELADRPRRLRPAADELGRLGQCGIGAWWRPAG